MEQTTDRVIEILKELETMNGQIKSISIIHPKKGMNETVSYAPAYGIDIYQPQPDIIIEYYQNTQS